MCKWYITLKCFQGARVKKVIWLDIGLKVSMFGERNSVTLQLDTSNQLHWRTLEQRRVATCRAMLYKISNRLVAVNPGNNN